MTSLLRFIYSEPRLAGAVTLIASFAMTPASAQVVFLDTYELETFSDMTVEEDLNHELPGARQSGAVDSLYAERDGSVAFILDDTTSPGEGDSLILRTVPDFFAVSAPAVHLTQNFGPQIADQSYEISFDGRYDEVEHLDPGEVGDTWIALAIGDTTANISGPDSFASDFAMLIRPDGRYTTWEDGLPIDGSDASGIDSLIRPTFDWELSIAIDETAVGGPLATVNVTAETETNGAVTTEIGQYAVDLIAAGPRFVSLTAFHGGLDFFPDPIGSIIGDYRVDNLQIALPSPGIPGDFNEDGSVDAADYTVWRDGLGTEFTPSDYNVWVANYGARAPASSATGLSVPQPSTLACLISGIAALSLRIRATTD